MDHPYTSSCRTQRRRSRTETVDAEACPRRAAGPTIQSVATSC